MIKSLFISLLAWLLSACSAEIDDYRGATPTFHLFEYFQGQTRAYGMVQDYTNQQTRRFAVRILGTVDGDTLTLHEDFVYDDGETDRRVWTITRRGHQYIGRADDIIGEAVGKEQGNALQWQYDFELQRDDSTLVVAFDDWLYRQDSQRVFNLTSIKKWGVEVGRVTLFFEKQ